MNAKQAEGPPRNPAEHSSIIKYYMCLYNFQPGVLSHFGTSLPHQMCCLFSILLTLLFLSTSDFLFSYLFHLGNGSLLTYYPITRPYSCESLVMYQHMQAENRVVVRLQCICLCVGSITQIPFLDFMPQLLGWENHPVTDVRSDVFIPFHKHSLGDLCEY